MKDTKTIVDYEYDNKMHSVIRWRNTLRLLPDSKLSYQSILEIGDRSGMTSLLEDQWGCNIISTGSELDLDFDSKFERFPKQDIILSCEVLEHLLNPLYHLMEVKKILKKDGILYLTTPKKKPEILWSKWHFNEMSLERLTYLFDKAGFRIINRKQALTRSWWFYLTGFRPLLRLFFDKIYLFELKHK